LQKGLKLLSSDGELKPLKSWRLFSDCFGERFEASIAYCDRENTAILMEEQVTAVINQNALNLFGLFIQNLFIYFY